jgi:molecular chaperone GrpE
MLIRITQKNDPDEQELSEDVKETSSASDNDDVDVKDPLKELEEKLNAARGEAEEKHERLLRVSADFENYKKRSAREMDELRKFANQSLLKEMLSVVDNLELAINSANERQVQDDSMKTGLDLTHKEILRVFKKFPLRP